MFWSLPCCSAVQFHLKHSVETDQILLLLSIVISSIDTKEHVPLTVPPLPSSMFDRQCSTRRPCVFSSTSLVKVSQDQVLSLFSVILDIAYGFAIYYCRFQWPSDNVINMVNILTYTRNIFRI